MTPRDAEIRRLAILRAEAQRAVERSRLSDARGFFSALRHLTEIDARLKELNL